MKGMAIGERLTKVRWRPAERPPSVVKALSSASLVIPGLMVSIRFKTPLTQATWPSAGPGSAFRLEI
jgi:hypothetical protein